MGSFKGSFIIVITPGSPRIWLSLSRCGEATHGRFGSPRRHIVINPKAKAKFPTKMARQGLVLIKRDVKGRAMTSVPRIAALKIDIIEALTHYQQIERYTCMVKMQSHMTFTYEVLRKGTTMDWRPA